MPAAMFQTIHTADRWLWLVSRHFSPPGEHAIAPKMHVADSIGYRQTLDILYSVSTLYSTCIRLDSQHLNLNPRALISNRLAGESGQCGRDIRTRGRHIFD